MVMTANVLSWQYDFITAPEKFICFMAGRRAGKTAAIKCRMVNNAMYQPGHSSLYLTPSGTLCNQTFEEMVEDKSLKKRIKRISKQPIRKIFFRNGSSISFIMFSGNSDKLRGLGFDEVYLDEVQSLDGLNNRDKIMMIVNPLIMDKSGNFIVAGQYRSAQCWWYKWFNEKLKAGDKNYRLFEIPSWKGWSFREGGYYHPEIQTALSTMPKSVFEQEIACIPTANANAAFVYEDLKACCKNIKLSQPNSKNTYVVGCDLGRTVDPSAWVVVNLQTSQIEHAELRRLGERHEVGAQKLGELCKKYNNAECYIDTTGGATGGKKQIDAYTRFYRERLPSMRSVNLHPKNKQRIIQNLILEVEQHNLTIPEQFETLIAQMEQYEFSQNKWGGFDYAGPGGHEDDLVIALALAYEGYRLGSYGRSDEKVSH